MRVERGCGVDAGRLRRRVDDPRQDELRGGVARAISSTRTAKPILISGPGAMFLPGGAPPGQTVGAAPCQATASARATWTPIGTNALFSELRARPASASATHACDRPVVETSFDIPTCLPARGQAVPLCAACTEEPGAIESSCPTAGRLVADRGPLDRPPRALSWCARRDLPPTTRGSTICPATGGARRAFRYVLGDCLAGWASAGTRS
jgi:hypothetical protein